MSTTAHPDAASPASTASGTAPGTTIALTDEAVAKVAELLAAETGPDESLALRVAVRPGGCSGFSYEMYFDGEIDATDVVAEHGAVTVVVDAQSAPMLLGATLRYSDGLQGEGFSIDNPNAQRSCGCGKSFS